VASNLTINVYKESGDTHLIGGWVGSRTDVDVVVKKAVLFSAGIKPQLSSL
jgi:hypothetical protein